MLTNDGQTPIQRVLARAQLLDHTVRRNANGWQMTCPGPMHARGDRNPSLSLSIGAEGRALLHCHAGCATPDVLAALGLGMRDLFVNRWGRP